MKKLILFFLISVLFTSVYGQNPSYQQKLYFTCKVWGFMKYYHSRVSVCEVNWDSVLTNTIPSIKNAITVNDFNNALSSMINAAGPMAIAGSSFPDTIPAELKRNRDFSWINNPIFRPDVKDLLDTIKNNFRPHTICWVKVNVHNNIKGYGWLLFPYDDPMLNIDIVLNYPGETKRLLLLFKYWNIIRYFNPYNYVEDIPWDSTLYQYLMPVDTASNAISLYKTIKKIAASINDAHVTNYITNLPFVDQPAWYPYLALKYVQNNYVVVKSGITNIKEGDIIIAIDNKTTSQWEDSIRPYISVGNLSIFRRFVSIFMLGGNNNTIKIDYKDSLGNNKSRTAARNYNYHMTYFPNDSLAYKKWRKWTKNNCNIGYVNMGNITTSDVNTMYNSLKNTTSIIFDVRYYPQGTAWSIANLMYPEKKCFSKLMMPDVTYPGTFYWYYDSLGINNNANFYNGKVIIMFNEESWSQSEYSCMILEAMPNSIKVGSQTAGSDGNRTSFNMTINILNSGFTSLGVFYPNGDSTQRIGIVPDSTIYPTIDGIRHGRDEELEKALQIAGCFWGIQEKKINEFRFYPNPAKNKIIIAFNEDVQKEVIVTIFNIQGDNVFSNTYYNQSSMDIDVSSLAKGVYLVKIQSEEGFAVKKLVIQ